MPRRPPQRPSRRFADQPAPEPLVVPRGDGRWQVGGDGGPSLVLDHPDGNDSSRGLRDLADPGHLEHLRAWVAGPTPISPAGPADRATRPVVRVARDGWAGTRGRIGDALVDLLTRTSDVVVTDHATDPAPGSGDEVVLTVVVAPTTEPDRLVPEQLLRRDAPHLVVRPLADGAVVGPLVVPGRTGCVNCGDLLRRDADPFWPTVLHHLTRTVVDPGPVAAGWAAAYAAGQVLAYAAGRPAQTLGSTAELVAPAYAIRWRSWPIHPDCGCSW